MPPGLQLQGKQLQRIPPNASQQEQMSILNQVIERLNSNQQVLVRNTVNVQASGAAQDFFTIPHGLGYVPRLDAYLNQIDIDIHHDVNVRLPTFLGASVGGIIAGEISFTKWLYGFVDATNVYFSILNAAGTVSSVFPVTYTLSREEAVAV